MRDASYGRIRKASVAALTWRGTGPGLSVLETQKHQILWHELGAAFAGRGCSRSHPPWRCTVVGRTSDTLTHGLCPFFWLASSSSNAFRVKTPPEDHSPPRKVLSVSGHSRSCTEAEQTRSSVQCHSSSALDLAENTASPKSCFPQACLCFPVFSG